MSSYSDRIAQLRKAPTPARASLWAMVRTMIRARQTRRLLGEMDDRMLADVGLGRAEAWAESRRMMWDVAPRG